MFDHSLNVSEFQLQDEMDDEANEETDSGSRFPSLLDKC